MSRRRNVRVAMASSVLAVGVLAAPAYAVPRTFILTLQDGSTMTVVVDAPAETPPDQVPMPPTPQPVVAVQEVHPPEPTPTPTQTPEPTATPTPEVVIPTPEPKPDRDKPDRQPDRAEPDDEKGGKEKGEDKKRDKADRKKDRKQKNRNRPEAVPDHGVFDPVQQAIPDIFINRFRIPPFLLPIYQAAGIEYGIRWEILAAINEIETNYGRNLNVSYAGAEGWMQFMPATWKVWGTDANRDGRKDPYNPVDAIFSAARYLKAAGAAEDLRAAIWAYNHADWYVNDVLYRARALSALPGDLVASLTGLADGRFPVTARSRYKPKGKSASVIRSLAGAQVVAVNDGRIVKVTRSSVTFEDVYGNRYVYQGLGRVTGLRAPGAGEVVPVTKERLYANPERTLAGAGMTPQRLRKGMRILAGTVLGRLGESGTLTFKIKPAGRNAPWISPEPILNGWRLLDTTALYRLARGQGGEPTIGQVLLMNKAALERLVLNDAGIEIYGCGRDDIRLNHIDRRVLATLGFLSAAGLDPTVTSLQCGHSFFTASGNVSEHSSGNAVDIAAINGTPILGNQGAGSITDTAVRRLLTLQGTMEPHQIITLMRYENARNTLALADHDDHIHVGFRPRFTASGRRLEQVLEPDQWRKLAARLVAIKNPRLRRP